MYVKCNEVSFNFYTAPKTLGRVQKTEKMPWNPNTALINLKSKLL
jgi:hypothetical protein